MSLIISTHKNSIYRSEEIASAHILFNDFSHKPTNKIEIVLKSGYTNVLVCRTIKEAKEIFNNIIEIITAEYFK